MSDISRFASSICTICYKKSVLGEWALSMVGVEEAREFRFHGDLYSQESTFTLVLVLPPISYSQDACMAFNAYNVKRRGSAQGSA